MKKLLLLIPIALIFNACSQVNGVNPSQNKALNNVAGKKEKKPAYLQKTLDNWLKNDWNPTFEVKKQISKNNNIKNKSVISIKDKRKDKNFTLQEFVDKFKIYNKIHDSDDKVSNTKKLNSMPVIGK